MSRHWAYKDRLRGIRKNRFHFGLSCFKYNFSDLNASINDIKPSFYI